MWVLCLGLTFHPRRTFRQEVSRYVRGENRVSYLDEDLDFCLVSLLTLLLWVSETLPVVDPMARDLYIVP